MVRLSVRKVVMLGAVATSGTSLARRADPICYPWEKQIGDPAQFAADLSAQLCISLKKASHTTRDGRAILESTTIQTTAGVVANVYNGAIEVGNWEGSLVMPEEGDAILSGNLYAGGQQIWEGKMPAAADFTKQIDLYSFEKRFPKTVLIGPIPVSMIYAIRSTGRVELQAGIHRQALTSSAMPNAEANVYAEAGIGNDNVLVGAQGSINLINETFDLGAKLSTGYDDQGRLFVIGATKGAHEMYALDGKIDGIIKVGDQEQRRVLYEMTGQKESGTIFEKVVTRTVE